MMPSVGESQNDKRELRRLLTPEETRNYLANIQSYTAAEFGDADAFSIDYLKLHRDHGVQFYRSYAGFATLPPRILGLANCMFISHAMLAAMQNGMRKENALDPWTPADGTAVLWIASVVSDAPGVAVKCLNAALADFWRHPDRCKVDLIGSVCTGPEGYLMSRAFGLSSDGKTYQGNWLFMQKAIDPTIRNDVPTATSHFWSRSAIRQALSEARALWGANWKHADWLNSLPVQDREPL